MSADKMAASLLLPPTRRAGHCGAGAVVGEETPTVTHNAIARVFGEKQGQRAGGVCTSSPRGGQRDAGTGIRIPHCLEGVEGPNRCTTRPPRNGDREHLPARRSARQRARHQGGGSALLPAPIPPVTLEEKLYLTKQLASKGATIQELNTVRKSLSLLKGGGLARAAYPAQVVSLVLSDVIGDNLEFIASGPTIHNLQSREDSCKVLSKYHLLSSMPKSVKEVLSQPRTRMEQEETQDFAHVFNFIVGSNAIALEEAKLKSESLGYNNSILSTGVSGDVRTVARLYSLLIRYVCSVLTVRSSKCVQTSNLKDEMLQIIGNLELSDFRLDSCLELLETLSSEKPICLLAGGETTVQLQGKGKGGRNQELALHVSLELHQAKSKIPHDPITKHEIVFLSGGTDGQDGPTEAAGAFAYTELVENSIREGLNVEDFLNRNDSFTFFSKFNKGADLIVTGLTSTNVMDVHAILIQPKEI